MKKFKKLIPAMAMLIVSVIMLGSSTFAWFSMNNKVTASGMEVTAQANTQYLVISSSDDFTNAPKKLTFTKQTAGGIVEKGTNTNKVYPCKFVTKSTKLTETFTANAFTFYTANSTNPDVVGNTTDKTISNVKTVAAAATDYMFTYEMYIGLVLGSDAYSGELRVKANITGQGAAVIRLYDNNGNNISTSTDNAEGLYELVNYKADDASTELSLESVEIEAGKPIKAVVYLYIDGTNADVFTNTDKTTITGALSLEFTATGIAA